MKNEERTVEVFVSLSVVQLNSGSWWKPTFSTTKISPKKICLEAKTFIVNIKRKSSTTLMAAVSSLHNKHTYIRIQNLKSQMMNAQICTNNTHICHILNIQNALHLLTYSFQCSVRVVSYMQKSICLYCAHCRISFLNSKEFQIILAWILNNFWNYGQKYKNACT